MLKEREKKVEDIKIEIDPFYEDEFSLEEVESLKSAIEPLKEKIKNVQEKLKEAEKIIPQSSVCAYVKMEGFEFGYKSYVEDLFLKIHPESVELVVRADITDQTTEYKEVPVGTVQIE